MPNSLERHQKEAENLFKDPKFARQAWKAVGQALLQYPCTKPIGDYNKQGELTLNGMVEEYSYRRLHDEISEIAKEGRQPTELEMILYCQMVKARFDTNAATFVRDTLGAKPVDESKVDAQINNPYESLSDEELELIAKSRQAKLADSEAERLAGAQSVKLQLDEVAPVTTTVPIGQIGADPCAAEMVVTGLNEPPADNTLVDAEEQMEEQYGTLEHTR